MSPLVTVLAASAGLLLGVAIGLVRPLRRLDDWMWAIDPERHSAGWWAREAYAGVVLALHPRATLQALRKRRTKVAVAAPEYDPNWANRETT